MRTSESIRKSVPQYWKELESLPADEKLEIIMLLTSSLKHSAIDSKASKEYTKEMLNRFNGAWVGEETPDEIIDNINKSKSSHSEPVVF